MLRTTGPEKLWTAGSKGFVCLRAPVSIPLLPLGATAPSNAARRRSSKRTPDSSASTPVEGSRRVPSDGATRYPRSAVRVRRDHANPGRAAACPCWRPSSASFAFLRTLLPRLDAAAAARVVHRSSWIIREERMRKNYSCGTGLRTREGLAGDLVAVRGGSFDFASVEDAPVLKHVPVVHRPKRRLDGVVEGRPRLLDGHRIVSRSFGRHETPRSCSCVPRTDGTTSTRQWTYGDADA